MNDPTCSPRVSYRLRFEPVADRVGAVEVPCDAQGRVELDALDDGDRNAYLYARIVGRLRAGTCVVRAERVSA